MPLHLVESGNGDIFSRSIDILISACGFESRATSFSLKFLQQGGSAKRQIALGFLSHQVLSYNANKRWFQNNDFEVVEISDTAFRSQIEGIIGGQKNPLDTLHVAVDISCFNRFRLAQIIDFFRKEEHASIRVVFVYNLAEYSSPPLVSGPTSVADPVTPEFSGWTSFPSRPPAAILGLGYEPSKAIGIVDHLEINSAAWAFLPVSPIPEYKGSVLESNKSLFDVIATEGRVMEYDVMDPSSLFRELNALTDMLKGYFNPILIPFGPKIFALVALLVACVHDDVGVWRVSSADLELPSDRRGSEYFAELIVTFSPIVENDYDDLMDFSKSSD